MTKRREIEISVIGLNYIDPILTLYEKLDSFDFKRHSKIRRSQAENGYSVSIISLSVLLIESILNRVRFLRKYQKRSNLEFFTSQFNNPQLADQLNEVYIIRDLIVHNHIWNMSFEYDENYNEVKLYRKLLEEYGDKKYKKNINKRRKCTKILLLNIIPTRIGLDDVIIIFQFLKTFFMFLENQNSFYFPLSPYPFSYKGENSNFYEIVDKVIQEQKG